jgi:hypothetical protein
MMNKYKRWGKGEIQIFKENNRYVKNRERHSV